MLQALWMNGGGQNNSGVVVMIPTPPFPLPTPGGHCSQVFEVTFLTLYFASIILWLRFVADDGRVSAAA